METGFVLLLFISCSLFMQGCAYCPNNWMRYDDSCYLFVDLSPKTWHEALEECVGYGGNLVRIDSPEENDFIKGELRALQPGTQDQFWTAGNDVQVESEWTWAHSRDMITLSFWHPGEPNHLGDEDCLAFYTRYNFDWNDEDCDHKMSYICELSDPTLETSIIG